MSYNYDVERNDEFKRIYFDTININSKRLMVKANTMKTLSKRRINLRTNEIIEC